jgi:O-antigen ligase
MVKVKKKVKSAELTPLIWILASLLFTTLYFQTTLADPFNSPKLWIVMLFGAWLLGYVLTSRNTIRSIHQIKYLSLIVITFIGFLLISSLLTDYYLVAFFGETQRRNGFVQYFSLAIILVATSIFTRISNVKKYFIVTFFIALVSAVYSLLQTTGNDFVDWINPYNSVIGTVGNPNFAAAVMAVMGVLVFSTIFNQEFSLLTRLFASALSILLLFVIYKSNARQGLLAYALGLGVFLTVWLLITRRPFGIAALLAGGVTVVFSILGILQIGPLERFLYKNSVSVRGYYWQAGLEMFKDQPLFGVGIDRYGSYFKEFRDSNYSLTYGFEITSSNAHNTFIQFFATGGIFVGLAYLILNTFIFLKAVDGLKHLIGAKRIYLIGVFSAWIAFHAQSLISIDNIGISIWGWVLGGVIVGLSVPDTSWTESQGFNRVGNASNMKLTQLVTSWSLTLMTFVLVALLYRGESNSYKGTETVNLQDQTSRAYYKDLQLRVIQTPFNDNAYKLFAASRLLESGFVNESIEETKKVINKDPRNLDALTLLVFEYQQKNDLAQVIFYRLKIAELDPWNAPNYLALGRVYKGQGDLVNSDLMLKKILAFASAHPIATQAMQELAP